MSTQKLTPAIAAAYWDAEINLGNKYVDADAIGCLQADISAWHECKLLLSPLSAISDEHAVEVANITEKKDFSASEITDYLRSKGYDMGYGSIPSLIEAGIALNKTTLVAGEGGSDGA